MSKIVIDGRMINESGIGRYIKNLITHLQTLDHKNEYLILHLKEDFQKLEYSKNFHKILANFRWYGVNEQVRLLKVLKELKPDLVHFPHFNIPFFYSGKFIVTIHDLIHQHFSMQRATTHGSVVYKLKQFGYKKVFKKALTSSAKILVPSNFVKEQLITSWNVESQKITVTYEAVDEKILNLSRKILKKDTKKPYIFYVGNAHPHKNVEGLIKVFKDLKGKYSNLQLVLSGSDHYFWQTIKKEYQDKDIIYTGQISDEQLTASYKNAICFVMPSFEEGFGIPILEAMACSCPVVSSNAGSLPEIGGDACLYFNPGETKDMYEKIEMVLQSDKLKKDLISKGAARVKGFSWKRLSEQTLEVYKECV